MPSIIYPDERVIDDTNAHEIYHAPAGLSKGWVAREYDGHPICAPMPIPVIPRLEWSARISEMEATGRLLSQRWRAAGKNALNQNGTNYCWCNAVVTAMEALRCAQGQADVSLSPASVAAPIRGYANQGGYGTEAIEYIQTHGIAPSCDWPVNAIDRKYATGSAETSRTQFKIDGYWELEQGNFDALMTCLLLGFPCPMALGWWGHEICGMDPVDLGAGKFGVRILNSWGQDWGDQGFEVLSEAKATADDQDCIRSVSLVGN